MIPNELYSKIFFELSISDLNRVSPVSRRFCNLIYSIEFRSEIKELTFKRLDHFEIVYLRNCFNLSQLSLSGYRRLGDNGLNYVNKLINLKELDLTLCVKITDIGLKLLTKLINLTHINLSQCIKITDVLD
jgi:hypothetical protein